MSTSVDDLTLAREQGDKGGKVNASDGKLPCQKETPPTSLEITVTCDEVRVPIKAGTATVYMGLFKGSASKPLAEAKATFPLTAGGTYSISAEVTDPPPERLLSTKAKGTAPVTKGQENKAELQVKLRKPWIKLCAHDEGGKRPLRQLAVKLTQPDKKEVEAPGAKGEVEFVMEWQATELCAVREMDAGEPGETVFYEFVAVEEVP